MIKKQFLPRGATTYILGAYIGVRKRSSGKGIERRFKWLDGAGKNWEGGIRAFSDHLKEHFQLDRVPLTAQINGLLNSHGKAVFVIRKKRHRAPSQQKQPKAVLRPASLNSSWDQVKKMVTGMMDALEESSENQAYLARVGGELWAKFSGMTK